MLLEITRRPKDEFGELTLPAVMALDRRIGEGEATMQSYHSKPPAADKNVAD